MCLEDVFRVQEAVTITLHVGRPLYALGLDACFYRGKLNEMKLTSEACCSFS